MKSFINLTKVFLLFNITAFILYLPLVYVGYYMGFGLAMILVIIASGVSGFYVSFQVDKTIQKSGGRSVLTFLFEMVLTLMAWYFLYNFVVLQQGKVTPLIKPSSAKDYADYTFFRLKNHQYNTQKIVHYESITRNKEGSKSYTNYYACPIIDQNNAQNNTVLWLGYDKSGTGSSVKFFLDKTKSKYEYFAKYTIEQGSYRKAIRTKTSKELSKKSFTVYGVNSPEQAKKDAWNYYIYFLLIMNIVFWILWVIISFYDNTQKTKELSK